MLNKLILFISSYIPLYVLLIIKNIFERVTDKGRFLNIREKLMKASFFDEINDWAICILLFATIISFVYLANILRKNGGNKKYKVVAVSDETTNYYFNYISIYLLSCMGLTLNSIVDCFVFIFLMVIIGYIYISNNMVYMNPVINLMGYKVYDCTLESVNTDNPQDKKIKSIVVAPKKYQVNVGENITGSGKQEFIYISR